MNFVFQEITTHDAILDAIRIRIEVFINEQGFQPGWEPDEHDKSATQYVGVINGNIIATARVRELGKGEFKIERMAIQKEYRKKGVGKGLAAYILEQLKKKKPKRIWLQSQLQAQVFYEKIGFKPISEATNLWGAMHIDMEYIL